MIYDVRRLSPPGAVAVGLPRLHNTIPPTVRQPRQLTVLEFFQRKHMFHRRVFALKFLAATISISCASVQ